MLKEKLLIMQIAMIAACVLLAGGGNLLLKSGMNQMGSVAATNTPKLQYALQVAQKPQVIIGLAFYVLSMVVWLSLLSMMDISLVYPAFIAASFLFVTAGSVFWFHEHVSLVRVLGIIVVVIGIGIVSISGKR